MLVLQVVLALSAAAAAEEPLGPGARLERRLSGGDTHTHRVAIPPGDLLEARVTEDGIHVSLSLQTAGGTELLAGSDRIRAVAGPPGDYLVVVSPLREDAPAGSYALEIAHARAAEEVDRLRFAADRAMHEGRRVLAEERSEASVRRAEMTFTEARRLYAQADDLRGQFDAVCMIGETYDNRGDMRAALAHYQQGLELARSAGEPLLEADALHWMGMAEGHLGRIESGEAHVRTALEAMRGHGDRRREGQTLLTLAFVLGKRMSGDEAFAHIEEALPLLAEYGDVEGAATARHNLGVHFLRLGEGERAVAHLQEALATRRRIGSRWTGATLSTLGNTLSEVLERPEEALPLIEEGYALRLGLGDRIGQGWSLDARAAALARLARPREARADYERALAIWRELDNPQGAAMAQVGMGKLHAALGEGSPARRAFEAALELARRAETLSLEADARLGLARLALAAADLPGARREAEEALRVIESARTTFGRTELRAAYFGVVRPSYELYVDLLMRSGEVEAAFRASERARARTLLDAVAASEPAAPPSALPLPLDVPALQRRLEDGTGLVEYALGEERSFAWVITRGRMKAVTLDGRAAIEAAATRFVERLTARNAPAGEDPGRWRARVAAADAALPAAARELSDRILRPLDLTGVRRLVVVADGALHYVPFAALPLPDGERPLVARAQVVVAPSAAVVETMRAARRPRGAEGARVVALADPVFRGDDPRVAGAGPPRLDPAQRLALRSAEDSGLAELPRLRFSRGEAQAIESMARGGVRLFLDFEASRDAVGSEEVRNARVVHFATHGLLNSRNPALTGLVLSMVGPRGRARDGFLRLGDVHRLRLQGDLVVLSACQTALGKQVRGEGLLGLTRGFMVAGAPRVVASLWRVHDQATAELMKRFYAAYLDRGLPPAEALGEAQRSLRADPRWRAPYYWAAFTFNGDWR